MESIDVIDRSFTVSEFCTAERRMFAALAANASGITASIRGMGSRLSKSSISDPSWKISISHFIKGVEGRKVIKYVFF